MAVLPIRVAPTKIARVEFCRPHSRVIAVRWRGPSRKASPSPKAIASIRMFNASVIGPAWAK